MKLSARNPLRVIVLEIVPDSVNSEVIPAIADGA
jgi:molybdopterin-binding protein